MEKQQRLVLIVAILASLVAFLDSAVVNVALPAIQKTFGGGLATQQWIVDAYLLTLGSCILIAGSVSDLYGRQNILRVGLIGFGVASVVCAVAPNNAVLIAARGLQGLAGALLVPSSLALITNYISGNQFTRAIGLWTAWTGIAFVIGPLVGGFLTDTFSWRWVFAINIFPILLTLFLLSRLPREQKPQSHTAIDMWGAVLCALGLASFVYGLIEQPRLSWHNPLVLGGVAVGTVLLALFLWHERRTKNPMMPLSLFKQRNFSVGNIATFAIYAGLSVITFLLVVFLQQVAGYSALTAGLSLLPITILMFLLSSKVGSLSERFGPRIFMAAGPIVAASGLIHMVLFISPSAHYTTEVLPGILLLGFGLVLTVTPLTSAILEGVAPSKSGIASAINNAVARIAGLLAVAAIGGILATSFNHSLTQSKLSLQSIERFKNKPLQLAIPENYEANRGAAKQALETASLRSFSTALAVVAGLLVLGGVISAIGITNKKPEHQ